MTRDELLDLIAAVQRFQSEMDDVEVKAAQHGTPQRLYESLSAFANRAGGGVILLGLDENLAFQVVGVRDAHRVIEETSNLAAEGMEPALRPEFTLAEIDGKPVVAIEVFEVALEQKPCFYKAAGLQSGAYIRVGNTNRQMSGYEVFSYLSARAQPVFDEEPMGEAVLEDLGRERLEEYIRKLRRARLDAMRRLNLEPPRFQDRRSSFLVTFRNHTLMGPEAIAWLNRFADRSLNDRQRLALVYLRYNKQLTNSEYQRLNRVDSVTAGRELRGLVQAGLIEQQRTRRWAYYTIASDLARADAALVPFSDEERILAYLKEHDSINNAECRDLLQVEIQRASNLLRKMHKQRLLKRDGERRWARYTLP